MATVEEIKPVNRVVFTVKLAYPVGKLSAKAGQELEARLSKVDTVALDRQDEVELAKVDNRDPIKLELL